MAPTPTTARLAGDYLLWFIPAMALQFPIVAMGAALRGTGNFKPGMVVQTATIIINIVLAPFLIFGWGTGRPLGVAGAAIVVARRDRDRRPLADDVLPADDAYLEVRAAGTGGRDFPLWRKMLGDRPSRRRRVRADGGLPGHRLLRQRARSAPRRRRDSASGCGCVQAGFMPVVALGFSVAPVAGQNFGARQPAAGSRHVPGRRARWRPASWSL